jgi:hypothetical protein
VDADRLRALLDGLDEHVRDLPHVNAAAHLAVLVRRVERAVKEGADPTALATQLEAAAADALNRDPWVRVQRAAADVVAAIREPLPG